MSLKQTKGLIDTYGLILRDSNLDDLKTEEFIQQLADPRNFPASPGYVDPKKPVTDANHNTTQAMLDFVLVIAPTLSPERFHALTQKFIELAPETVEQNSFMRRASLEKVFLAYEMAAFPNKAESHFELPRMKEEFKGRNDIQYLKNTILNPLTQEFNIVLKNQLDMLKGLCKNYKLHLETSNKDEQLIEKEQHDLNKKFDRPLRRELMKFELVQEKYDIVNYMLYICNENSPLSYGESFAAIRGIVDNSRENLVVHRNTGIMRFLEMAWQVLTLGLYSKATKNTFAFWKSHGEVFADNISANLPQTTLSSKA